MKRLIANMPRGIFLATLCAVFFGGVAVHPAHANFFDTILSPLGGILTWIGGLVAYTGGTMLDYSINEFVLNMGTLGQNQGVVEGWRMLRDLVNITFVFGLLYVGMITILKGEGAGTRQMLISIIIGALLVNFSLFFARVVIDISNVAATEIYYFAQTTDEAGQERTLTEYFMHHISLQKTDLAWDTEQGLGGAPSFPQAILFTILASTAGFVFGAAAILLIIRFAVLMFLMILSPVMFVATFLPIAGSWASKWWHTMINQALFAPAFLFMCYLALLILDRLDKTTSGSFYVDVNLLNPADTVETQAPVLIMFSAVIILLITGLILARQMGMYGANTSVSIGKNIARRAGRIATSPARGAGRLAAFTGRSVAGGTAKALRERYERGEARMGKFGQGVLRYTGVDSAIRGGLSGVENRKIGGRSFTDDVKAREEREKVRQRSDRANKNNAAIARLLGKAARVSGGPSEADDIKILQGLSLAELKDIGANKLSDEKLARHLTSDQIKKIKDSKDEFGEQEKADIAGKNKEGLKTEVGGDGRGFAAMITNRKMNETDAAKVVEMFGTASDQDRNILKNMAPSITSGIWRKMESVDLKKFLRQQVVDEVPGWDFPDDTVAAMRGWGDGPGSRRSGTNRPQQQGWRATEVTNE